jgi:hypothetical protein
MSKGGASFNVRRCGFASGALIANREFCAHHDGEHAFARRDASTLLDRIAP